MNWNVFVNSALYLKFLSFLLNIPLWVKGLIEKYYHIFIPKLITLLKEIATGQYIFNGYA